MKKSIYYLTFNGIFNNTNGVGSQTKILLEGLFIHNLKFKKLYGDLFNILILIVSPKFQLTYPCMFLVQKMY